MTTNQTLNNARKAILVALLMTGDEHHELTSRAMLDSIRLIAETPDLDKKPHLFAEMAALVEACTTGDNLDSPLIQCLRITMSGTTSFTKSEIQRALSHHLSELVDKREDMTNSEYLTYAMKCMNLAMGCEASPKSKSDLRAIAATAFMKELWLTHEWPLPQCIDAIITEARKQDTTQKLTEEDKEMAVAFDGYCIMMTTFPPGEPSSSGASSSGVSP